jgi:acetylornithine/N-succinyldiaminopimelate aminotransferase
MKMHNFETPTEYCPFMPTAGPPKKMFVRGQGTKLWDDKGNEYLDFLSGLAVTSLGHAHPAVAKAVADQAGELLHVSNLFAHPNGWKVAQTIDRLHGGGGQVFFSNSGAEANECAIKVARKWGGRGKYVVLSAYGSFHGRTLATLHATGQPAKHETFQPLPEGFRHAAWNDLEAFAAAITPDVAAILLEPVQGEGGVNPAEEAFFKGIRALCDERGLLFMVDEVQTGFARTGNWFGYQRYGIQADVVSMAKALGNGVPIGACWARREVAAVFAPGDHATTYGGNPLVTAAAAAVLEEMERIDAPALATQRGKELTEKLLQVKGVSSVRGVGLLLAVELEDRVAKEVADELLERGLIVNAVTATALRLAPPLNLSSEEIVSAITILADVLG